MLFFAARSWIGFLFRIVLSVTVTTPGGGETGPGLRAQNSLRVKWRAIKSTP